MACYSSQQLVEMGFARVGQNPRISTKASFYGVERIELGDNVRIDDFCTLSAGAGGIKLGNCIHIALYSSIVGAGRVELGDYANISGRVSIYSSSDDYSGEWMTNPMVPDEFTNVTHAPINIGKHCIIGAGAVVLPGVVLGDGAAVGALSLVNKSLAEWQIYAGQPAKRIKSRSKNAIKLQEKLELRVENS